MYVFRRVYVNKCITKSGNILHIKKLEFLRCNSGPPITFLRSMLTFWRWYLLSGRLEEKQKRQLNSWWVSGESELLCHCQLWLTVSPRTFRSPSILNDSQFIHPELKKSEASSSYSSTSFYHYSKWRIYISRLRFQVTNADGQFAELA